MSPHSTSFGRKAQSCYTCQRRDRSEWCALRDEDVGLLDRLKIYNNYQTGQVIFYQGNPCLGIYCIEDGTVGVRKTDADGNSMLVRLAHPGQTLGYRTFFSGSGYSASAEALTPARICFIDKSGVALLLERNPSLGQKFLLRLATDLEEAEDARLQASTLSVRARLAHLLLTLKDRFGSVTEDGTLTIQLPLTRQDLASMVGTRPETIARTIRVLTDEGVAKFAGRIVTVPDLDALLDETELVSDV